MTMTKSISLQEQSELQQQQLEAIQEINQGVQWISPSVDSSILASILISTTVVSILLISFFKIAQRVQVNYHRVEQVKQDTLAEMKTTISEAQAIIDELNQVVQSTKK
ncbi:MAG: hypothetical protein ACRC8A_08885 [Microcoleaceae cyanobacterium]